MQAFEPRRIFVAGGTGYLGRHLIPRLLERGFDVDALTRKGSESRVPSGCHIVPGNALDPESYRESVNADTFVHLVGVPNPNPSKARLFLEIDLPAVRASVTAAVSAGIRHFVYLSVAQPAPVMRAYVDTRREAEEIIRESGLPATMLRPWYVLGPGHRWAYVLIPFYKICERIPSARESALRMGLVTLRQMIGALTFAVETPCDDVRIIDVPEIRKFG